jgi:hypothetical protein
MKDTKKFLAVVGGNGENAKHYKNGNSKKRSYSNKEFHNILKYVFKDHKNLNFSKVVYTHSLDNIKVICKHHGTFEVCAKDFIHNKFGCPHCYNENARRKIKTVGRKKLSIEKYKKRLAAAQPELKLLRYTSLSDPAVVECTRCGQAWIRNCAISILKAGQKLQCTCNKSELANYSAKQKRMIELAEEKYPQYDFSKTKYSGRSGKIIVTCRIHGDFETTYFNLVYNKTPNLCKECQRLTRAKYQAKSKKEAEEIEQIKKHNESFKQSFNLK